MRHLSAISWVRISEWTYFTAMHIISISYKSEHGGKINKAFRERQHPSAPRSVNEWPIHGPTFLRCSYLKKLTLKIQGQGHGWGQSSKSQCESNILSIHIPFIPCQSGIPLLSYNFFKIWPWNLRVKVMDEVTVQSHNVGVTSYRLTSLSFHVNRPSHSWDIAFSKFDLENQWSKSWVRSQSKVTMWV